MPIKPKEDRRSLICLVALFCALGIVVSPGGLAQTSVGVIPVTSEPSHKIRFDNGKVRVYEVILPKGKGTLPHQHRADNFAVILSNSEITNAPLAGKPVTHKVRAGGVGFASTAKGPYSHRVVASGDSPFHVALLELLSPKPDGAAGANQKPNPPFKVVRENSRGRVYSIALAPGESTGPFERPGSTAVFAISSGRVAEETDGKPDRLWDLEPGRFKWVGTAERLSLKNVGARPVRLVEIEVF